MFGLIPYCAKTKLGWLGKGWLGRGRCKLYYFTNVSYFLVVHTGEGNLDCAVRPYGAEAAYL